MSCPRHYELLDLVTQAGAQALTEHNKPEKSPAYQKAIARLRAHDEICEDCQADFKNSFPELRGKEMIIVSLLPEGSL